MDTIAYLFVVWLFFGGGNTATYEIKDVDPAFNRIELKNDSQYVWGESGNFNLKLEPGETVKANVIPGNGGASCYNRRYEGVIEAYQIVGNGPNGRVLQKYAERSYYFWLDGKNVIFQGDSVDDYEVFGSGDFYPSHSQQQLVPQIDIRVMSCTIQLAK